MKNFKIVMILVAAVAMFCSCSKEGPTATFTEKNTTLTYDLYTADQMLLEFDGNITAEAGIKTLKVTRTTMDSTDAVKGDIILFTFEKDPEGETAYPFTIKDTLFKAQLEKGYKVVYDVEVADKKDQSLVTPVQYTINIIDNTPVVTFTMTETDFTWVKHGNNTEDLSAYGLNWNRNIKATKVEILPIANAKLYVLESADYANTDVDFLNGKQTAEKYYNVKADQNGDYDDVIASVYNGNTYLFHVTKGEILPYNETTNPTGTKVTITGTVKTFDTVPTQTTSK